MSTTNGAATTLEARIAATLTSHNTSSENLYELIAETEAAVTSAAATAVSARVRASDLTACCDLDQAYQDISRVELSVANKPCINPGAHAGFFTPGHVQSAVTCKNNSRQSAGRTSVRRRQTKRGPHVRAAHTRYLLLG